MRKTILKPPRRAILLYSLMTLLLGLSVASIVIASPATTLRVDPHITVADVGETFNVNVTISDVTNLYGFQFRLRYDTDVLDSMEGWAVQGPFLTSADPNAQTFGWLNVTDPDGEIQVFITLLGTAVTEPSGSGVLATITFEVIAAGSSPLDLYYDRLGDRNANSIAHTTIDGYFGKPISITASPTSLAVGSNVTISGGIHPIAENEDIYIEYKKEGEATWSPLATRKTDASGAYSYTWKTTQGGVFKIRARWLTETSDEVTVTVEAQSPFGYIIYIAAAVIVVVVVAAVYFLKIRKPK